jgi:hypothetical protein
VVGLPSGVGKVPGVGYVPVRLGAMPPEHPGIALGWCDALPRPSHPRPEADSALRTGGSFGSVLAFLFFVTSPLLVIKREVL